MTRIPDILWSWVDPGWTQGARFGREKRSPSDREIDKETKKLFARFAHATSEIFAQDDGR